MAANDVSINIHDHGAAVDEHKKRFKCNYCGKVVSSSFRLKCHLGAIRGDVVPCEKVPTNVKDVFRNELLEKKKGNLSKEGGGLYHPNLPCKRNIFLQASGVKHDSVDINQTAGSGYSGSRKRVIMDSSSENSEIGSVSCPKRRMGSQAANGNIDDLSVRQTQKCIARFFYETGIDFGAARSPSFNAMVNATLGLGQMAYRIPSSQEFKGWILQDELKEMQHYVKRIRTSWTSTGCSILLDGWVDEKGRNLVHIIVDCPMGAIYLRSYDISVFIGDVDAMILFLEGLVEEIGIENVVQIITYSASDFMEAVGKRLFDKHKTFFWTVSASHCIELMLEKFRMMDIIEGTLEKATTITKFIYSHASVLKLLKNYTSGSLVSPLKIKSAVPFLTLENIVSVKKDLKKMFKSTEWNSSTWASTNEGKNIADLVAKGSFWTGAMTVLRAAIPLVRVLELINEDNKPQLGIIYETIDQAKETIKEEFNNKEAQYMPFWTAIDEIWNQYLYSPLHSAGYFLNPTLFYASDFYTDAEVASGLLCCIVRMARDKHIQDLITLQVEEYRNARGAFRQASTIDQISDISPVYWWTKHGRQYPELQRFTIRIHSQTCNGASKYKLKRSLAEQLLTKGISHIEQKRLSDLAFVHYNLHLKNFDSSVSNNITLDETDPVADWMVGEAEEVLIQNEEPTQLDLDCGDTTTCGGVISAEGSGLLPNPKDEPSEILAKM